MNAVYTIYAKDNTLEKLWSETRFAGHFVRRSVRQAKRSCEGAIAYTDEAGAAFCRDLGFDEIVVSTENKNYPPWMRSAFKLDTYQRQKECFLHVDWDFILWKKMPASEMPEILAQSKTLDSGNSRLSLIWECVKWKPGFIDRYLEEEIPLDLPCPAILGGRNVGFLSDYAHQASEILMHPKNSLLLRIGSGDLRNDVRLSIEQWLLGAMAKEAGIPVGYLTAERTDQLNSTDPTWGPKLGFTHLSGWNKRSEQWVVIVERLESAPAIVVDGTEVVETEEIELEKIPFQVLVSMEAQRERRERTLSLLRGVGADPFWKVPVPIQDIVWGENMEIYRHNPKYGSQALTFMKIFDEVEMSGADMFVHFEDDIVMRPNILEELSRIRVPSDWKFIYLGGRNCGYRKDILPGVVKSTFVSDLHAVIIRASVIPDLRKVLFDPKIHSAWPDFRFATLHWQHPAYLLRPNLFWQSFHTNDSGPGEGYSNYYEDGTVMWGQGD